MLARQDDRAALRYLIAQRRLYRTAKRWLGLRWFGMLVIGLVAPIIAVADPRLAPITGAVAGLWIFAGRTLLHFLQSAKTVAAAATQERFDFYVYEMPISVQRSALPSVEDLARIVGPDEQIDDLARREGLIHWYPIRERDPGWVSVAISQRANASYSDQLLRTTVKVWVLVSATWVGLLIIASVWLGLTLEEFLVGVMLPVLPAFLDVVEYLTGINKAARSRRDLVRTIEARIRGSDRAIDGNELMVWQDELHGLRSSAPAVPEFIYKLRRTGNERAMHSAAEQLGDQAG